MNLQQTYEFLSFLSINDNGIISFRCFTVCEPWRDTRIAIPWRVIRCVVFHPHNSTSLSRRTLKIHRGVVMVCGVRGRGREDGPWFNKSTSCSSKAKWNTGTLYLSIKWIECQFESLFEINEIFKTLRNPSLKGRCSTCRPSSWDGNVQVNCRWGNTYQYPGHRRS